MLGLIAASLVLPLVDTDLSFRGATNPVAFYVPLLEYPHLAGSLGLSCVRGASLEETLGEDSPLSTSMPATPATDVQPEDHRNALDKKVLQKMPVLAMALAPLQCFNNRGVKASLGIKILKLSNRDAFVKG